MKFKNQTLVTLVKFLALKSHTWLLAIILDKADTEHFYHCRDSIGQL